MRRIAGLSLLALVALAPTAEAATPNRVAGVKLSWPSKAAFKPGEQVSLGVRSQARKASVAFLAGHKVLARKTLRNGTFRMKVPSPAGITYVLRATVAGKSHAKELKSVPCTGNTGTLKASADAGRPGTPVKFTVTNTGSECMPVAPGPLRWVGPDGHAVTLDAWGNVRQPGDMSMIARAPDIDLQPGASYTLDGHVPERLPDGRYMLQVATAPGVPAIPFSVNYCLGLTSPTTSEVKLGAASVPAGGTLPYTLTNTGTGCLGTGVAYLLQRLQADGSFTTVNAAQSFISIGLVL